MVEVRGELAVTFKVKSANDVERIRVFCQEYEGTMPTVVQRVGHPRGTVAVGPPGETREKTLKLLKEAFPTEGFTSREAAAVITDKLGVTRRTTQMTLARALKNGTLIKTGKIYVWVDVVQAQVAKRLQSESKPKEQTPVVAEMPPTS